MSIMKGVDNFFGERLTDTEFNEDWLRSNKLIAAVSAMTNAKQFLDSKLTPEQTDRTGNPAGPDGQGPSALAICRGH